MQNVAKIQIQEHVDYLEAGAALLGGVEVEMPNRYAVLDGMTGQQLFFATERTGFIMRQLKQCFGDCAPWGVDIMYTGRGPHQRAINVDRPTSCTCLCLNRPTADVVDATTGYSLGSITDPCTCFSTVFHVRDRSGSEVLVADGGCCQAGLWFPCPFGPCAQVDFDLLERRSGHKVGHIRKMLPNPLMWAFAPDVDNYFVDFGKVHDPAHKALLMALAIYMDFRYWNDSTRDRKDHGIPFLSSE